MEQTALDYLALERLLLLAQELGVAFSITAEHDLKSLKENRCIQVHVNLRQWPKVAACMGVPEDPEGPAPRELERACASFVRGPRGRGVKGRQPEWRERDPLPAWKSATACFNCG
ncbi:unnamed protein product [Lampetra planeri]